MDRSAFLKNLGLGFLVPFLLSKKQEIRTIENVSYVDVVRFSMPGWTYYLDEEKDNIWGAIMFPEFEFPKEYLDYIISKPKPKL